MKKIMKFICATAIASGCFGFAVGLVIELATWLSGMESQIDWHLPRAIGIAGLFLGPIFIYGSINEKEDA